MLEEHVYELPDDVIERLAKLLADERIGRRRLESNVVTAYVEAQWLELHHCVVGSSHYAQVVPPYGERRQRALADDHGVNELDGDVVGVRPRLRRGADREQAAAAHEALGQLATEVSDPFCLCVEEACVRVAALDGEPVESERLRQTAAGSLAATAPSHSRHSSRPSPVFALTTIRSTSG